MLWIGGRLREVVAYGGSTVYFEKVHVTIPKGIVGDFEYTLFYKEFWMNGTRGYGGMFASS